MPQAIRVVSFNIQHGRSGDGERVDIDLLCRACESLKADVLALQEVDVGVPRSGAVDQPALIAEATGLTSLYGPAMPRDGGQYGNALLVRGDIHDADTHALPWERDEPRSAIVADITAGGHRFTVLATHLSFHTDVALSQLQACLSLLPDAGPRLLLGDLNLVPADVKPLVGPAGLAVAGGPPTFPARRPRARIDHVAAGGGLVLGAVEVITTPSSDHRALAVEVQPPPGA